VIIGLLALEQNAWMTERERKQFFELLDVPRHQINSFVYQKQFVESRDGDITTVESFRPFITLPRWMKNRIKFRLRHPTKFEADANFYNRATTFNSFIERIIANE
jgi:hypothetical protein